MPDSISDKWLKLVCQLRTLNKLVIPRQNIKVIKDEILSIELHGFCDSSLRAYGSLVYLRVLTLNGCFVSLLSGKTKVAPMKGFSIPRLELLGCVLLTKLMNSVKAAIKPVWGVQNVYYWTDSEISLYRIKGVNKEWKQWVESRVNFVRDGSVVSDWNFVPSGLNPADIVTREFDFVKIQNNDFYWQGPRFLLSTDRTGWPHQKNFVDEDGAFDCEVRSVSTLVTVEETVDDKVYGLDRIIDASRYSSLKTLLMVTCFVIRVKNNLLAKLRKKDFIKGQIDTKEFNKAEKLWIISEQKYLSNENFKQLKNNLDLFYDDLKILRLKGRFGNSSLLDDQKYPVLLRTFSHFTDLVVLNAHEKVLHGGLRITLNHIRGKFWICQSRRVVNKVLRRCVVCKRSQGRTMKGLPPPDLPTFIDYPSIMHLVTLELILQVLFM